MGSGTVHVVQRPRFQVVVASGEHDLSTAGDFRRAMTLAARGGTRVVVDLTDTTFIDSSVLNVMMAAAAESPASLAVVAPSGGEPRRILDLLAFRAVAPVVETTDAGLAALNGDGIVA